MQYLDLSSFQFRRSDLIWMSQQNVIVNYQSFLFLSYLKERTCTICHVSTVLFLYLKILPQIPLCIFFHMQLVSLHLDLRFFRYDLFPKNTCFRLAIGLVKNPRFLCNYLRNYNGSGSKFHTGDIQDFFRSGFLTLISEFLQKKRWSESSNMTRFA